jgi:hypothetical protein
MKKNSSLHKLNNLKQKTAKGLAITVVVEFALTYGFASWAIDSGNLLIYFITALLLVDLIQNLVKLIKVLLNGKHQSKPAQRTKK